MNRLKRKLNKPPGYKKPKPSKEFYRYEDDQSRQRNIDLITMYLDKETPCGYWITKDHPDNEYQFLHRGEKRRWVSKTTRKRFAYPTKEQAMYNYIKRKERHALILSARLDEVKIRLTRAYNDHKIMTK